MQKNSQSGHLISSGSPAFNKFIGGGFRPGYPWLFVTDSEAEGIAVSVIGVITFDVIKSGYPTFIMTVRDPWGLSMKRYQNILPKTHKRLMESGEKGRLSAINFSVPPRYKPLSKYEKCIDLKIMPYQLYEKIVDGLKGLKTEGKPIFWRLSSISEFTRWARYYGDEGVIDTFKPLLTWFQMNGAVGIASINRARTSEKLMNEMVSLFPNVMYVNTELGKLTRYHIQIAKSMNPKASPRRRELKITPGYRIVIK